MMKPVVEPLAARKNTEATAKPATEQQKNDILALLRTAWNSLPELERSRTLAMLPRYTQPQAEVCLQELTLTLSFTQ